jgi:tetratricopeptide (TPR) repeat protein
LEYLQQQEAITADSTQKFALGEQIAEAIARIAQFEAADQHAVAAQNVLKADISRIVKYAPAQLIGREKELKILSDAWQQAVNGEKKRPHILTFVALGGEGKTSLVAKWTAELAHEDWPGCEAAFAWSFYSQGTSEKTQASSDSFLKEALVFFGDVEMANSAVGSFDKGRRVAQLIGERRALLILDGVEPLQYAPTSPTGSELKDQGVSALLKALATKSEGLCVVTTRYSIPDLRNFWQSTAPEIKLTSLSILAGVALLRTLGVKGTREEFEQVVKDVKGHALTLNLLGSFLRDAHAGDIRKLDLVKLEEADVEEQGGHAFHLMDAYVNSFKSEGEKGTRALSILRLLGLFDRPATADCLNTLWTGEEIGGLNGPLINITEAQRNITLKRLEDAQLIAVNRSGGSALISLDAHPLLREYFANRLRQELPGAWRAAHRRLYQYLRDNTHEGTEPTLEDLQPLYQAVTHGCQAGLHEEAYTSVFFSRIQKGNNAYALNRLGAFGSDLGAVANFFEEPWRQPVGYLTEARKALLFNKAAFRLRALGRLTEALEPMRAALEMRIIQEVWTSAAINGSNLSELELTLGEVAGAVKDAEQSVTYADRSGETFWKMGTRTTHANALHQAGRRDEAEALFRESEQIQKEDQPYYPLLYSQQGFIYCDFLLEAPERAAGQSCLDSRLQSERRAAPAKGGDPNEICRAVSQRAAQTLHWAEQNRLDILSAALDHLTLGRAALYATIRENSDLSHIDAGVDGLRRAGQQWFLPNGLLTRAWLRCVEGDNDGAQEDLDEAWEIAERGPMRLHMADIHLYRARLFHAVKPYPWNKNPDGTERGPKDDLKDSRALIEQCGYWRRKEELEDAEEAAQNW